MQYRISLLLALMILIGSSCKKPKPSTPTNPNDTTGTGKNPTWQEVGKIEAGNPYAHATIAFDNAGIAYVLYQDGKNGYKATVKKFESPLWVPLGAEGFSDGSAAKPNMVINPVTGRISVVYIETSPTQTNKVRVMSYDGGAWVNTGSTLFQAASTSAPAISTDNTGALYVAYIQPPAIGRAKKYDGTTWTDYFISPVGRNTRLIDIAGGINYLAYSWDTSLAISNFEVLKRKDTTWTNLNYPAGNNPTSYSLYTDKNGVFYIALEGKSPARLASVMQWDNNKWYYIGLKDFSPGIASNPRMAVANDSLRSTYITYRDGNDKISAQFNDSLEWHRVGPGFTSGTSTHVSMAVHPVSHIPYIAYTGADGNIVIMKYE